MSRRPASARVLAISADLSELLVLRRVIRDAALSVETARNANQAVDLLAEHRFVAVVVDEALPDGAAELLAELETRRPDMLRILIARPEHSLGVPAGTEVVRRPFYAEALRRLLTELALRVVQFTGDDDTLPTRVL